MVALGFIECRPMNMILRLSHRAESAPLHGQRLRISRGCQLHRPVGRDLLKHLHGHRRIVAVGNQHSARGLEILVGVIAGAHALDGKIDTDRSTIQIELAAIDAPLTVENVVTLARRESEAGRA